MDIINNGGLNDYAAAISAHGLPNFNIIIHKPAIKLLIDNGQKKEVSTLLTLLLKKFCNSFNVVRNMNNEQILDCVHFLIDECGNFRIEDYILMFNMGKLGKLGKILDRVDISVIAMMKENYEQLTSKDFQEAMTKPKQISPPNEEVKYVDPELVVNAFKDLIAKMEENQAKHHADIDAENERRKKIIENRKNEAGWI